MDVAEIVQLLCSPVHRFHGRPGDGPGAASKVEIVPELTIRAHRGIVGDRYFGKQAHRDASITIIAAESLPPAIDLTHSRRNVLLRGFDIDAVVGSDLAIESESGQLILRAHRPANPCAWMDVMIGPGARHALRNHGGVRCEPLTDGVLRLGPVRVLPSPVRQT